MPRKPNNSMHARAVLAQLSEPPLDWHYGYDLLKRTGINSGTLYPMLIRFHEQGLLEAEWQPATVEGRPPRHAYRLTASGLAFAAAQRERGANPVVLIPHPARS
jgi:PadR family transcriptional regulator, regulatory protein PadR